MTEIIKKIMSIYQFSMVESNNRTHYVISYTSSLHKMRDNNVSEDNVKPTMHWMESQNATILNSRNISYNHLICLTTYVSLYMPPRKILHRHGLDSFGKTVAGFRSVILHIG